MRLYRNRQGLTKGKKNPKGKKGQQKPAKPKHDPNHRTRPELALELIIMVAQWFPNEEIIVSGDSATAVKASSLTCRPTFTSSAMCIPMEHSTSRASQERKTQRTGPQERGPVARHEAMGRRSGPTVDELKFDQFGLHTTLEVKTIQALYYKAGKDRLLTIVLTRNVEGKRPDQMFYCTKLDWTAGKSCRPMLVAGPLNAPLRIASSSWAWRTLPIVFPRPSCGPRRWRCSSTLW